MKKPTGAQADSLLFVWVIFKGTATILEAGGQIPS